MSSGLLIIGAGGHGKVVADAAQRQGKWEKLGFLDDKPGLSEPILGLSILGSIQSAAGFIGAYPDVAIAIGGPVRRLQLIEQLSAFGFNLPVIRHPSAVVSPHATVQAGSVLFAQSVVNADARLGIGCIVNTSASVDHDCVLGDGVHLSPGAHLAGGIQIGRASWIGIGACVRENVQIGEHVIVGAGAVVVSNVQDSLTVVGAPAAPIARHKR